MARSAIRQRNSKTGATKCTRFMYLNASDGPKTMGNRMPLRVDRAVRAVEVARISNVRKIRLLMFRPAIVALSCLLLPLAACDEAALSDDPEIRVDARGTASCARAVQNHTGNAAAAYNPGIPVVEVNQYVIDVPGVERWLCYTDDSGRAQALVRLGDVL
jgi:hypothetical protein